MNNTDPIDPLELPLELKFKLKQFESEVERMSLEQARLMLVEMNRLMVRKDHIYRQMLQTQIGGFDIK